MLRRKRGADYGDLSDSDDGGEARRRMKRRQFAKMQRALFEDERIEKIAENPRNLAFLKSIEDRGSDDEMDFVMHSPVLPGMGSGLEGESQQSASHPSAIPDSQPGQIGAMGPPPPVAVRSRAPFRRTKDGKRPANLGEIRESLSNLLEEPNDLIIPATEPSSDHSAGEDEAEGPAVDRESARTGTSTSTNRRHERRTAVAVVDRITLKRDASTSSNDSTIGGSTLQRLAFATATTSQGLFKVPALLRRATTNSILSTASSTSTTSESSISSGKENRVPGSDAGSSFREEGKIKRTAGKRSGVNYFARETERRVAVVESEKRRERKRLKGAEGRGKAVSSLFGGGRFE
jgi:mediator of replication checkpoint protein 1